MFFIPVYILILFSTIVIDYFAGILIERSAGKVRRMYLVLSLIANIGVLAVFKYYNFAAASITEVANWLQLGVSPPLLGIILPIGLSFHTFQAMSYTIEVYWDRTKAERHFGIYALYVMFYPQLVAGPIERPQNLLHQFRREHHVDYDRIVHGLKLMTWGLFKKVVIADRIAEVVDLVYANPYGHSDLALMIATILYAYQIYCDFSGYSDIAIGAAQVMGFSLMTNFRRPYYARSIQEFWSRWHISLSTWFRDYLYIPLRGNRVSPWRWRFNLFVVFLVSGLWHGANWTFVIWGGLHGIYMVIATVCGRSWRRTLQGMGFSETSSAVSLAEHLMTLAAVAYAWIFFRAASVSDAFHVLRRTTLGMPDIVHQALSISGLRACVNELLWTKAEWLTLFLSIAILELYQYHDERGGALAKYGSLPTPLRWAGYYAFIAVIILLGSFGAQQFIYFQF